MTKYKLLDIINIIQHIIYRKERSCYYEKTFKQFVAFLLIFTLSISVCLSVLAAEKDISQRKPDETKQYYIDLADENGEIITVLVEENTYYSQNLLPYSASVPGDYGGQIKTYTYKFTNAQIGAAGTIGSNISKKALEKLKSLSSASLAKSIGTTIAGGLLTVSEALKQLSVGNTVKGRTGFKVTFTLRWQLFEHKIQGIQVYDWGITKANISSY